MKRYGLLGYPLGHSFSKSYFDRKFTRENINDATFENFEVEDIADLHTALGDNVKGFSVTIPHKRNIIPLLSRVDPTAEGAGAVNCVKILPGGEWVGYNTDVVGFEVSLLEMIGRERPAALVFGSGGASGAVKYVLGKLGIEHKTVSRHAGGNMIIYKDVDAKVVAQHRLLINCTPLGMHPDVNTAVDIPYEAITGEHYLYDLVYNPAETLFLRRGRYKGARVKNGIEMLSIQAEAAWSIWNS